jgi:hypothetical protein
MGGGVGEAMLIGAAMGGGSAAMTGGDPLKGALLGAAGGGFGAGIAGAQAGGAAGASGGASGGAAGGASGAARVQLLPSAFDDKPPIRAQMVSGASAVPSAFQQAANSAVTSGATTASNPMFPKIAEFAAKNPMAYRAGMGALGATVGGALTPEMPGMPKTKYDGPLSKFAYDPRKYRRQMASGGLADTAVAQRMMRGGHLGSYSDGGRLLKGPGDGMSDDIPAKIGRKQPARLADGEFVVPADVVSGIGNGSTDAGAKRLYQMMDRVRSARTGSKKQGREIKAEKYLPT